MSALHKTIFQTISKNGPPSIDYFILGGGSSGGGGVTGSRFGGGGAAGQLVQGTNLVVPRDSVIVITVGAGGPGVVSPDQQGGWAGSPSSIGILASAYGGLGRVTDSALTTGSTAGGTVYGSYAVQAPITSINGNTGGIAWTNGSSAGASGGGGGLGTTGYAATSAGGGTGGNGGDGIMSNFSGTNTGYGGGGAGIGTYTYGRVNVTFGGGDYVIGKKDGDANKGAGGAGSDGLAGTSGAGGSGVVIIRYPDTYSKATVTGSPIYVHANGYHIYIFNNSGSITL